MKISAYIDNLSDIYMIAGQFEKLTNTVVEIECEESNEGICYNLHITDDKSNQILLSKGFSGLDQIFPFAETMLTIAKIAKRENRQCKKTITA